MAATRAQVLRSLEIAPHEFVVEVGGGHEPFARADLILDKYPFDNCERTADLVFAAPVVIADATRLPLPDKGCDVLFASHILEHLAEAGGFLEEARRSARRIYLEFPSRTRELMYAWSFHRWLIEVEGRHLIFYRNDLPQLFGDFFHRNYDALFHTWTLARHQELNSSLYCATDTLTWEFARCSALEHVLACGPTGAAKINEALRTPVRYPWRHLAEVAAQQLLPERLRHWAAGLRRRWRTGGVKPLTQALADRLACPRCHERGLVLETEALVCRPCGARYLAKHGLFDLDVVMDAALGRPPAAPAEVLAGEGL